MCCITVCIVLAGMVDTSPTSKFDTRHPVTEVSISPWPLSHPAPMTLSLLATTHVLSFDALTVVTDARFYSFCVFFISFAYYPTSHSFQPHVLIARLLRGPSYYGCKIGVQDWGPTSETPNLGSRLDRSPSACLRHRPGRNKQTARSVRLPESIIYRLHTRA